jgi:maltose/maltodextrin transport system permease protein
MANGKANLGSEVMSPLAWLKWLIVVIIVAYSGYMVVSMYLKGDVAFPLLVLVVVTSGVIIFLNKKTYAHRYAFPAIAGMVTFIIFPMIYTISIAFTNYSGDHTLTVDRAMKFHLDKVYRIPADQEGGGTYLFKLLVKNPQSSVNRQGQIVLQKDDDSKKLFISEYFKIKTKAELAKSSESPVQTVNLSPYHGPDNNDCKDPEGNDIAFEDCMASLNDSVKPAEINTVYKPALDKVDLILPETSVRLRKTQMKKFEAVINKYDQVLYGAQLPGGIYYTHKNLLKDNETGKYFAPDENVGFYRYLNDKGHAVGDNYVPGFKIAVGFHNFSTIFEDEGVRGPFFKIFVWTVVFAALTVFITLAIGMVLACLVQWEFLKGRSIYRVFLILPYAVPAFISILVFRGLFNESFGEINAIIKSFLGIFMSADTVKDFEIPWFSSPIMAKSMILIVNAWLGYPYMMILCMGLLKSIPEDLYEASAMDGSSFIDNFFSITLPLLIKPLTPLLIASFAFNFNNFVLIMLLTNGSPDILDANPQAGETDLLVSYTYRIAFQGNGGQNYGLAAAIATLIFILVGAIAVLQLWFTRKLAEEKPIA